MARGSAQNTGGQSVPERIALAGHTMYRDSNRNKDQRYINCFQESIKDELKDAKKSFVVKRPGLTLALDVGVTGTARGVYYFNGKYYSVIGSKLYENTTEKLTLSTSSGVVGFEPFDNAGVSYLFLCDGTNAYVINTSGTVTQVNQTYSTWAATTDYALGDRRVPTVANGYYYEVTTDSGSSGATEPTWPIVVGNSVVDSGITWTCMGEYGGFPSPHIPTPRFVDGYMLLSRANSADVHNSDVDNIYGWGAGNFFTAEMWPDSVLALARQNNQVIAFGTNSSEFFYDAATTGGSPFQRNEAAVLQMGIASPYAIYQNEKFCAFIGQSQSGGRAVWLIEGYQPKKISTEFIERILDAEGTSLVSSIGYGIRTAGHLFYVINLTSTTLVYDLEEKVWHEWQSASSVFPYNFTCDTDTGKLSFINNTTGKIYNMLPSVYTDAGTSIQVDIYTSKFDGNTMNRKFCHNMNFIGDLVPNDSVTIRWSDDDYQTWSNFKTLSTTSRPFFTRLGSFRRRAFHIRHSSDNPFRGESLELELDLGSH